MNSLGFLVLIAKNPVLFNLSHDFKQGTLKKQEIYNQSNQLISRTEIQYTANGGIKHDSTYAVRYYNSSYSFPGFSGNYAMTKGYYILFKKFRVQSQITTTFSTNGSGIPTISSINSTYKDEMPSAYREKYKRNHNFPVKVSSTDEEGNNIETQYLYTGDFGFDLDQTLVCPADYPCPVNQPCPGPGCEEWEYTVHVPPYSSEGRGVFESIERNIINTPIETRQTINGITVSANYTSLFSGNDVSITLPRKVYSLKTIPNPSFAAAFYDQPNSTMVKDLGYGELPVSEILSYNSKGHGIDSKITKGITSRTTYLNPTIANGSIANLGKPDVMNQSMTFGKVYLGADKIISPNLLENRIETDASSGRVTIERDKENRVIKQYNYNIIPGTSSLISWNESASTKNCSGSSVTLSVYVNGLSSSAIAQFSTDGGINWQNANIENNGFSDTRFSNSGTQEIRARASDNLTNVIITQKDLSCNQPIPFSWGNNTVSTQVASPLTCLYTLEVNGLSTNGTAQFSIDNVVFHNAQIGNNKTQFLLYAAPSTQQFWARDSNNPSNVITVNLNVCQP